MIHDGHLPSKHPSCSVRNSERQRRINSQLHCRKLAQGEKRLNPLPPLLDGMVSVCGAPCRIKCCRARGTPDLSLAGPLRSLSWSSWSRQSLALGRTPVRSTKHFQHKRQPVHKDQSRVSKGKREAGNTYWSKSRPNMPFGPRTYPIPSGWVHLIVVLKPWWEWMYSSHSNFRLLLLSYTPSQWLIGCRLVRIIWVGIVMFFGCKSRIFKTNLAAWLKIGVPKNPHHFIMFGLKNNPCGGWVF